MTCCDVTDEDNDDVVDEITKDGVPPVVVLDTGAPYTDDTFDKAANPNVRFPVGGFEDSSTDFLFINNGDRNIKDSGRLVPTSMAELFVRVGRGEEIVYTVKNSNIIKLKSQKQIIQ